MISVGIIAYNEEKYLPGLLEDILKQDSDLSEIQLLLIDSMSNDNTRKIMENYLATNVNLFNSIKIVENKKRIQAGGVNELIKNAEGDIIIRLDAHSRIPKNFISSNLNCIESGESVCGGKIIKITDNEVGVMGKILLMADNSMFGAGIAKYRRSNKREYVNSIANGCYKKEVFRKVGGLNENLIRTEDNDIHYRIRKEGYKVCLDDNIFTEYIARNTLRCSLKQKWGNGKWVGITSVRETPRQFSLYHYVPALFVIIAMMSIFLFITSFVEDISLLRVPLYGGIALYVLLDIILSFKSCFDYNYWPALLLIPFIFPLFHFAYGFGTLWGIIVSPFIKFDLSVRGKHILDDKE